MIANPPAIFGGLLHPFGLDVVAHWTISIVLPIQETGGCCNCTSGHDLSNENHPSSILAAFFATNVKAKVHLIETDVKWNRETAE
jgi:hypothetical protein